MMRRADCTRRMVIGLRIPCRLLFFLWRPSYQGSSCCRFCLRSLGHLAPFAETDEFLRLLQTLMKDFAESMQSTRGTSWHRSSLQVPIPNTFIRTHKMQTPQLVRRLLVLYHWSPSNSEQLLVWIVNLVLFQPK